MTVVDLWTIQIVRDGPYQGEPWRNLLAIACKETEENLTDLLPAGYRARIRRWDNPDPDDDPGGDEDA